MRKTKSADDSHSSTEPVQVPRIEEGGCHCGAVRFSVKIRTNHALTCNCSICHKKGFVNLIVPAEDFELLQGAQALRTYRFNTKTAQHNFCATCGIHTFTRPRSHPDGYDINARCLDNGISTFTIEEFDGQNWEASVDSIR